MKNAKAWKKWAPAGIGGALRVACAVAVAFVSCDRGFGFLGVGDTSFVTVIADPAETANWAAQLASLAQQLEAVRGTLDQASALRTFVGDPMAAVQGIGDLRAITGAMGALSGGGQTASDLQASWQGLPAAERAASAVAMLEQAGAGSDGQMLVFGQPRTRNLGLYGGAAQGREVVLQARGQIAQEQSARAALSDELAGAWSDFQSAQTQTRQQALLAKISQLQAQNQAMDARRRALVDDLGLEDRRRQTDAAVKAAAADEQALAESAALNAAAGHRAQSGEAQRLATLQKVVPAPAAHDYSGLKLWTTADAAGSGP